MKEIKITVHHIIPTKDEMHSTLAGIPCDCKPFIEEEDGFIFIIHNSYDLRKSIDSTKKSYKSDKK